MMGSGRWLVRGMDGLLVRHRRLCSRKEEPEIFIAEALQIQHKNSEEKKIQEKDKGIERSCS